MYLQRYLQQAAERSPDAVAVRELSGATISYGALHALTDCLRDYLYSLGISSADRVGFCLGKSIDSLSAIFGVLKTGAAYVPVDPGAPASRNAYIFSNCKVAAVLVEARLASDLTAELEALGTVTQIIVIGEIGGGEGIRRCVEDSHDVAPINPVETHTSEPQDLAYILYTSGSTGKPKGVTITHENAVSFIEWSYGLIAPSSDDRFSSHAPFHFDLSVLDVYVPIKAGASMVILDEETGKSPVELAKAIERHGITVWYSAPSILTLLLQFGDLESHDCTSLHTVLFAGEVFPIVHLRNLKQIWQGPRYFNLYGPTETNVCTAYQIPEQIPGDRSDPYPIGKVCSNLRGRVVGTDGRDVPSGEEGELVILGPNVTKGYWNLPEQTANAYLKDDKGQCWYRTGDLVFADSMGDLVFVGRRDRMVKKRGYRIELGEIESCLYQHAEIIEAATVSVTNDNDEVVVVAHLATKDNQRLSGIKLKKFCSERLPLYMLPDAFKYYEHLPKTSTDKIDYQALQAISSTN